MDNTVFDCDLISQYQGLTFLDRDGKEVFRYSEFAYRPSADSKVKVMVGLYDCGTKVGIRYKNKEGNRTSVSFPVPQDVLDKIKEDCGIDA